MRTFSSIASFERSTGTWLTQIKLGILLYGRLGPLLRLLEILALLANVLNLGRLAQGCL